MPLEIITVPCLEDNYAFIACDTATGTVGLIDVPEAAPIIAALEARGWVLDMILITHHHDDHILGVPDMVARYGATVIGAKADAHRLPPLDRAVAEGDSVQIGESMGHVLDVSGHTIGHIAFHFPDSAAAFTADSLMALGCGRLFEGDADIMWPSMLKMKALPEETVIYSGHEYTQGNAAFAITIEPENQALLQRVAAIDAARARGEPTVPSDLREELATNPFLRADLPEVKAAIGMAGASDVDVFREIRARKDSF